MIAAVKSVEISRLDVRRIRRASCSIVEIKAIGVPVLKIFENHDAELADVWGTQFG